jgi:AcrR family transcriptional regulator
MIASVKPLVHPLPAAAVKVPAEVGQPAEPARSRGRPRNPQIRDAILRAARELMNEAGPSGLTMEAVAERAGVGKPTVYRWWPNRHAVAMAALMDQAALPRAASRKRSPLRALEQQLRVVADTLVSRQGRSVTAMIAAADPDTEVAKAFRHHFVLARRSEGRALLEQAVALGDVRADLDVDTALDQIYGALFFRVLMGHAAIDAAFVRALVRQVVRGLAPR